MHLPPQINPDYRMFDDTPEMAVTTQIRPISLISGKNQVQFIIPKYSEHVVDLKHTRLGIQFTVTKEDGSEITVPGGKYLSTINSQLSSFFQQISISINNEHVLTNTNNHILSFVMQHLNYSKDFRKSILFSAGFEEAVGGTEGDPTGSSLVALAARIENGRKNSLVGRIEHPFFMTQKLLPPNTELSLTLTQGSDELYLMTDIPDVKFKVNLLDCFLLVRLIKLETSLLNSFQEALNKTSYIMPFKHTTIKSYNIAKGEGSFAAHNIHYGVVPSRVICLMVDTNSYLGKLTSTPFAFKAFGLNSHLINYNGVNLPLIKIPYSSADYLQLYEYINNELKLNDNNITPFLEYSKFSNDFFILAQNLIDNTSVGNSTLPYTNGSISIELKFAPNLTENVTLLVLSEFSRAHISIGKNNSVQLNEK